MNYVGISDLVLDIYNIEGKRIGFSLGGTVNNILVNLKRLNKENNCYCFSSTGNDWSTEYLLDFLKQEEINTEFIYSVPKPTKRINISFSDSSVISTKTCPNCGKKSWYNTKIFKNDIYEKIKTLEPGFIIIDCLFPNLIELVSELKSLGWRTVIDIGYPSIINSFNSDELLSLIEGKFDIIHIPNEVRNCLKSKFNFKFDDELFETFRCSLLSITMGKDGSKLLYRDSNDTLTELSYKLEKVKALDPSGAGDAYLSVLINNLNMDLSYKKPIEEIIESANNFSKKRILELGALGSLDNLNIGMNQCSLCGL